MSEIFTNRRGHQQIVEDDAKPEVSLTPVVDRAPLPKTPTQPLHRSRRKIRLPWRWLITSLVALVLLMLLVLEIVRLGYESSVSATRSRVQEIVTQDIAPALKQPQLSSRLIGEFIQKFESSSKSLCPGGFLDNFASLYPRSKQAYDNCTAYRSSVEAFIAALSDLQFQTAYLEELGPLLGPITESVPDRFAVLSSQRDNWQALNDSLGSLSVSPSFQPTHELLRNRVRVVWGLWIELVAATNARDSASFVSARDKLSGAYGDIRASAEDFETALSATQSQIGAAYSRL